MASSSNCTPGRLVQLVGQTYLRMVPQVSIINHVGMIDVNVGEAILTSQLCTVSLQTISVGLSHQITTVWSEFLHEFN